MSEKYFLGCMTQQGFSTEFGRLMETGDRFTYILKGGPGTGKSSLMKRAAAEFEKTEHVVRFYCSSDPASLDAVMLESSGVLIVDGTAPHVFDPIYPGIRQKIIDLGSHWDERILAENSESIIAVTDRNKSLHARSKRFSAALSNVLNDTFNCAMGCIDEEKLEGFLTRSCKKILAGKGRGQGLRELRQLAAMTEFGMMTMTETLESYQDIIILRDDNYACAHTICERTAQEAMRRGYDVILCPAHGLNNTAYEHLLIPETGTALVSVTPMNDLNITAEKQINLARFYDKSAAARYRGRLKMNKTTAAGLADEVYATIRSAKAVHDEIEKYYIGAMDFEAVEKQTEQIIAEIRARN